MLTKKIGKFLIILLILFFVSQPLFVSADGVFIRPLPGAFDLVEENTQEAFINYENGIEKLIVAVSIGKESSEAVWLLPIPAKPEEVKLDVVSSLPNFYGEDIVKKAKNADVSIFNYLILLNQTFFGGIVFFSFSGAGSRRGDLQAEQNLTVFQHLEKEGVVSEVISAQNQEALFNHLLSKGLKVEVSDLPALGAYFGKNYTFIVSWIDEVSENVEATSEERGIFITFPAKKLYFPLLLTSAYGEKTIPITLRIAGYVKPELYSAIKPFTKTTYYTKARNYKAVQSRCVSALSQLRVALEIYKNDNRVYPFSLAESEAEKISNQNMLMKEIKSRCFSFTYRVSPERKYYEATSFLGNDKEWMINSEGFAGEREIVPPVELNDFYGFNNSIVQGTADYTKIEIDSPAENFTQDLWMKPGRPIKIWIAKAVLSWEKTLSDERTVIFSYFIFNAILSFLIGGLLGLILFKKFKKYALVGLANLFSVIGLAVAFYLVQKRTYKGQVKPKPGTFSFVLAFSFVLIVLTLILTKGFIFLI